MSTNKSIPLVVLAGAGPGDPELITLKVLRYIRKADVLIVDRLVDHSLVNDAKLGAKFIFVGKEGGNPCSVTQETINQLLVSEARQGKLVLRLKGGDVSFFSNIFSELEALIANGIPYEIVPGVTAASGAAAYSGIPLTARGFSNSVRFLSYAHPGLIDETLIQELASTEDTLVFYMAARNLPSLVARLLNAEVSDEKWVAVIEQATTPNQSVLSYPINEFLLATEEVKFKSPSVIIIGKVAKLYKRFQWKESYHGTEDFFEPLQHFFNQVKVA